MIASKISLEQWNNDELAGIISNGLEHLKRAELLVVIDSLVDRLHESEQETVEADNQADNAQEKLNTCLGELKECKEL